MARAKPGALLRQDAEGIEASILLQQDIITLGRSEACTVVIASPTISRLHARVERQHDRYMLFDAGSANGTFLNSTRIARGHCLASGDEIWLGSRAVAFSFADPEDALAGEAHGPGTPLYIDECARAICVYGVPATLDSLEYRLLLYLACHPGTVCTREACLLAVWGRAPDRTAALDECIAGLCRQLSVAALAVNAPPPSIASMQLGFRLDTDVVFAPALGRVTPNRPQRPM